jgi:hypothetical protein
MIFNRNVGGFLVAPGIWRKPFMARLLATLAFVATIAATGALAQNSTPVHYATINNVKVSGVVATNTNTGAEATSLDSVNLLDKFCSVQPAIPVLTAPGNTPSSGASKDCVGHSCGR